MFLNKEKWSFEDYLKIVENKEYSNDDNNKDKRSYKDEEKEIKEWIFDKFIKLFK